MGLFDILRRDKEDATKIFATHVEDKDGHARIAKEIVSGRINSISSIMNISGLLITATTIFLSQDLRFLVQFSTFCSLAFSLCTAATGSVLIYRLHSTFVNWLLYADRPLDLDRLPEGDARREPAPEGACHRAGYSRFHILNRLQQYTSCLHWTLSCSLFFFFFGIVLIVWRDTEFLKTNPYKDWSRSSYLVGQVLASVFIVGISTVPLVVYFLTGVIFYEAEQKLANELDVDEDVWKFLWTPKVSKHWLYNNPIKEHLHKRDDTDATLVTNTESNTTQSQGKSGPVTMKGASETTPLIQDQAPVKSYDNPSNIPTQSPTR